MRFKTIGLSATGGFLTAALLSGSAYAQCPLDDTLEDNDDCFTAVALPIGLTTNLQCFGDVTLRDDDHYTVTLPPGSRLDVTIYFSHALGDVDMQLLDITGGCPGLWVDGSGSVSDNEDVHYTNTSGAPMTLDVFVYGFSSACDCNDYDMDVVIPPPICSGPDDTYEDNDTCATAVAAPTGITHGLQVHGAWNPGGADPDFWLVNLAAGDRVEADITFSNGVGNLDLILFDATAGCPGTILAASLGAADNEALTYDNLGTTAMSVVLLVDPVGAIFDCNDYSMNVNVSASPCGPDDSFEDNDDCATASAAPLGATTGLRIRGDAFSSGTDEDWWALTLQNGERLDFNITHTAADGDLDLIYYDVTAGCPGINLGGVYTGADMELFTYDNWSGAPMNVVVHVDSWEAATDCNDYDMNVAVGTAPPTPCSLPDDTYEDNDDCFTAVPLPDGNYTGLWMSLFDFDYYSTTLPAGATLTVDMWFSHSDADCDIYLWDAAGCGGTYLYWAASVSDNENFTWTNTSGVDMDLIVQCFVWGPQAYDCASYDLDISGGTPGQLGTAFCFGDGSDSGACPCGNIPLVGSDEGCLNVSGLGAKLTASGMPSVSADTLVLTVEQAAPSDFGIFVQNTAIRPTPAPFYNGLFCLNADAHLVRHYAPPAVQPTTTDPTGMGTNAQAMTLGDYLGDTQPGVTIYYQFWGRDNGGPCGAGANFSSGRSIVWQP